MHFLYEEWTEPYLNTVWEDRRRKLHMGLRTPYKAQLCRICAGVVRIVVIKRKELRKYLRSSTGRAVKRFDQRSRPEHANVQAQRARTLHLISVSTLKREVLIGRAGTLEV